MTKPSLLPYLESEAGKCRLSFFSEAAPPEQAAKAHHIISDSAPFSSILTARFVTDYGATIQDSYVLIQKDRYDFPINDLYPVGNKEIDALWQRAFSLYASGEAEGHPIILAGQVDEEGRFLPFNSLFLCTKKGAYFHPPCPTCGNPLEQCEIDDLLVRSGLHPYSTSRFRYLFCSRCATDDQHTLFYGYETYSGSFPHLKNRHELILSFEALASAGKHPDSLPCLDCPDMSGCYGAEKLWMNRIVPFSFFPFHMILFPGNLINAFDFFSLCAGAEYQEYKRVLTDRGKGHQAEHLDDFKREIVENQGLLGGSGRYFLEVLFLKITFLQTLFRTLFSKNNLDRYPILAPDLDRIWVNPSRSAQRLPFFWTFDLILMDFGDAAIYPSLAHKPPVCFAAGHMGLIWFYLLLSNSRNRIKEIYECLSEALRAEKSFEDLFDNGQNAMFEPENIFWHLPEHPVDAEYHDWWRRALSMGWDLFHMGSRQETVFDTDAFSSALQDLQDAVRAEMFTAPVNGVQPKVEDPQTVEIHKILSRLKSKWRSQVIEADSPAETAEVMNEKHPETEGQRASGEDEWGEETIVQPVKKGRADHQKASLPDEWMEEDEKTVIQRIPGTPPADDRELPSEEWEEKTVIQRLNVASSGSGSDSQADVEPAPHQKRKEVVGDDETPSEATAHKPVVEPEDEWDDRTIIQRPKAMNPAPEESSASGERSDDEWDDRTLIQRPKAMEPAPEGSSASGERSDDEWDDRTVIQRLKDPPKKTDGSFTRQDPEDEEMEDLPKTSIFRPSPKDRE